MISQNYKGTLEECAQACLEQSNCNYITYFSSIFICRYSKGDCLEAERFVPTTKPSSTYKVNSM